MMTNKISLARLYYPVTTLGPGNRVGLWLTGCNRNCDGCISPELRKYDVSREVSAEEILRMIDRIKLPIDGFTISGGEPFFNPQGLATLVEKLSKKNDDILIFTGYMIEELKSMNDSLVDRVLSYCSAVVDGPYIKELNDGIGLRGSSNQRIHIWKHSEKYADAENMKRDIQTIVYGDKVLTIGIPCGDVYK